MKAIVVRQFGGPEQLRLTEAPDPVPGPGQVRIAVHAAGVNPVDAGNRSAGGWAGLTTPFIPGYDVAGVIESLGPEVSGLVPADRVMSMTSFPQGAGGYAELVVVAAGQVALISEHTTFADAAAAPVAGGTALAVLARLALPPGSRLLVLGASGGVGQFLLQLAAARGIQAVAVGRRAMHDQMRKLGAAWCVDYASEDVAERTISLAGGPVDAIADLVGGKALAPALAALRPGGQITAIETPELALDPLLDANLTFHGLLIGEDGDRTRLLASLLGDGLLRPVISHLLPLSEAAQAHRIIEDHHPGGKVVLSVQI